MTPVRNTDCARARAGETTPHWQLSRNTEDVSDERKNGAEGDARSAGGSDALERKVAEVAAAAWEQARADREAMKAAAEEDAAREGLWRAMAELRQDSPMKQVRRVTFQFQEDSAPRALETRNAEVKTAKNNKKIQVHAKEDVTAVRRDVHTSRSRPQAPPPEERIAAAEAEVRAAQEEMRRALDELWEVRRQVAGGKDASSAVSSAATTAMESDSLSLLLAAPVTSFHSVAASVGTSMEKSLLLYEGCSTPSAGSRSRASALAGGILSPGPAAPPSQGEVSSVIDNECMERLHENWITPLDGKSEPTTLKEGGTSYDSRPYTASVVMPGLIHDTTGPREEVHARAAARRGAHDAAESSLVSMMEAENSFLLSVLLYVRDLLCAGEELLCAGEEDDVNTIADYETYATEPTVDGTRSNGDPRVFVVV